MKVLHYIPGYNFGGIESLFKNLILELKKDKNISISLLSEKELAKDELEYLEKNNIELITICSPKNFFSYIRSLQELLQNNYDIIHCHSPERGLFLYFFYIFKKKDIKKIILHTHALQIDTKSKILYFIKKLLIFFVRNKNFTKMACSEEAAHYFFQNKKVFILKNGVQIQKFRFNKEKREEIRKSLNLDNRLIIGHIGRITPIKNQSFLIDIFQEIFLKNKNVHLLLIGDGDEEYKNEIIIKIKKYKLEKNITFLGRIDNINDILNAIDLIIFPSISEGFGITLIEAQINRLPCFVSDTIPKDVKITNQIYFISLKENAVFWSEYILNKFSLIKRKSCEEEARIKEFDIKNTGTKLINIYKELDSNES